MRNLIISLVCLIILSNCNLFATPPYHLTGDGSAAHPFLISSYNDLVDLSSTSTDWSKTFFVTQNISCSGSFTPIVSFSGVFNGQGHIISNLTIYQISTSDVGLFSHCTGSAAISNLNLSNVNVTGRSNVAGLIGSNDGTVYNCTVSGNVHGINNYVGALIGKNSSTISIRDCSASGNITGDADYIGGLMGQNSNSRLENCSFAGTVIGTNSNYVGGLLGLNLVNINNCFATGSASASFGTYVGGLIGINPSGTITNCYASVTITGNNQTSGGFIGQSNSLVSSCHATGNVSVNNAYVGGFMGYCTSNVSNCYSTGNVTGNSNVAGLLGFSSGSVTHCLATGSVTGNGDYIGGLIGESHNIVNYCYATGNVISNGGGNLGGLIGNSTSTVSNCYSTSNVTGISSSSNNVGGLIGYCVSYIYNSYSTGNVFGNNKCGGFVGRTGGSSYVKCYSTGTCSATASGASFGGFCGENNGSTYSCCYWDTQTSLLTDGVGNVAPDPSGITGLTTAQMKTSSIFTTCGWLASDWSFNANNYPQLLNMPSISVIITTPTLTEWTRIAIIISLLSIGVLFVYRKKLI